VHVDRSVDRAVDQRAVLRAPLPRAPRSQRDLLLRRPARAARAPRRSVGQVPAGPHLLLRGRAPRDRRLRLLRLQRRHRRAPRPHRAGQPSPDPPGPAAPRPADLLRRRRGRLQVNVITLPGHDDAPTKTRLRCIEVAKSVGVANTTLAAFDDALIKAGIGNFNLIRLSSVIPPETNVSVAEGPADVLG